jgi:hypothetical protein
MKERCRCGNRVPPGELKAGLCRACVREAAEKKAAEEEACHLMELKARYLSGHPFYPYMED